MFLVCAFVLGWIVKPGSKPTQNSQQTSDAPSSITAMLKQKAAPGRALQAVAALEEYVEDGKLSKESVSAAVLAMQGERDLLKQSAMFMALLDRLTAENAEAMFLALSDGGSGEQRQLFLNAWGRIDGLNAIKILTERAAADHARGAGIQGDGRSLHQMHSVMNGWATSDPHTATRYVDGLSQPHEKRVLTLGLLKGLMVNGVDQAVGFVGQLPEDDQSRDAYMSMIAGDVLKAGVPGSVAWVDALPIDLKGGALTEVTKQFVREDLPAAKAWVGLYVDQDYAQEAVTAVANHWAEVDPQAVIEWADQMTAKLSWKFSKTR